MVSQKKKRLRDRKKVDKASFDIPDVVYKAADRTEGKRDESTRVDERTMA